MNATHSIQQQSKIKLIVFPKEEEEEKESEISRKEKRMKMTTMTKINNNNTVAAPTQGGIAGTGTRCNSHGHNQPRHSLQLQKFGTAVKYKKAPQAPRRFKSSYIFFSTTKHKEIRAELTLNTKEGDRKMNTPEVAKLVSKAWKTLSEEERGKWEALAKQDRIRYEQEKLTYTGPWKVPVPVTTTASPMVGRGRGTGTGKGSRRLNNRRPQQPCGGIMLQQSHHLDDRLLSLSLPQQAQTPPPTRPLSTFLAFSKNIKHQYTNEKGLEAIGGAAIDMSPIVAQLWIEAIPDKRKIFVEEECQARQQYEQDLVEWKKQQQQQHPPPGMEDTPGHNHHQRDEYHHYGEHEEDHEELAARRTTAVDEMLANNDGSSGTKMSTSPLTSSTTDTTSSSSSLATSIYSNDVAASMFAPIPSYTAGFPSSSIPPSLPHLVYSHQQYQQQQQYQQDQYYSPHYYQNNHATATAASSSSYYNNDATKHNKYDNTPSSYHSSVYNQYNYNRTAAGYNGSSGSSSGQQQYQY